MITEPPSTELCGPLATLQNSGLPSRASVPSITARTPRPGSSTAPSIGVRLRASRATAVAKGCRLDKASRAATSNTSGLIAAAFSTRCSGIVSVPVLSKTTVSTSAKRSMASPELRMIPILKSVAEATTWTVGIASASAQGHVMISTAITVTTASWMVAPASSHPSAVSAAVTCTTGA